MSNLMRKISGLLRSFLTGGGAGAAMRSMLGILLILAASVGKSEAQEDWRERVKTIRIGLIANEIASDDKEKLFPFRRALSEALQIENKVVVLPDEKAAIMALAQDRLDYVALSSSAFSLGWQSCKCIEPMVSPTSVKGFEKFHSVIAGPDPVLDFPEGTSGKTLFVSSKRSFSAYLFPKMVFQKKGILIDDEWTLEETGNMENAARMMFENPGSIMSGWIAYDIEGKPVSGLYDALPETAGGDISILWQSEPVPLGPHVVRRGFPDDAKVELFEFLVSLAERNESAYDAIEPVFGGGFVPVNLEDFRPIIDLLTQEN